MEAAPGSCPAVTELLFALPLCSRAISTDQVLLWCPLSLLPINCGALYPLRLTFCDLRAPGPNRSCPSQFKFSREQVELNRLAQAATCGPINYVQGMYHLVQRLPLTRPTHSAGLQTGQLVRGEPMAGLGWGQPVPMPDSSLASRGPSLGPES